MKQYNYYIYLLTTTNNKVIYIGVTNNLQRIIYEHQNKLVDGFTKRYNLIKLVYYEHTADINLAIQREKEIKRWRREKKNKLVESLNPNWKDLSESLFHEISQSTDETGLLRNDNICVTGLIITAGLSSRMGKFKPLLQYKGKSFLQSIITKLDSVCDEIVVVTGHNKELIETELKLFPTRNKIKTIFNENYNDGMFTSLQKGLEYSEKSDWILYHFIDHPTLPNSFYKNFISRVDNSFDWIQPKYKENNGHPILINKRVIDLITKAPQTSNLKEISHNSTFSKKYWDCNYSEIHDDIDTIERYNDILC